VTTSTLSLLQAVLVASAARRPVVFEEQSMGQRSWLDGCKPTRHTGIWKMNSGFRVRARAADPRTGAQREANRTFEGITLEQAVLKQAELRQELRRGGREERKQVRYAGYVESLTERKLALGELKSAKSRERWADTLDLHLVPYFGGWYVDQIRRADVLDWLAKQAVRRRTKAVGGATVDLGTYSPRTVNGWLSILLTTLREARADLELAHDATEGIAPLDVSTRPTYSEEEPNSLTAEELRRFLGKARELYPQHFAMLALGFATGRRPSELRGLRRRGPEPDVLWKEGVLLVRRSVTLGEAMESTKTGRRLRIPLPRDLLGILQAHAEDLRGRQGQSDLLFPSEAGGYRAGSVLDRPIRAISRAAGIRKALSARCMRRTFQDLGRAAGVEGIVVRAISGHATAAMQDHYSTVQGEEVRAGLARVIELAGLAQAA
jgi:integrase